MVKVLVTGGAGFFGSHLVDKLIVEGHSVVVIDNLSTGKKENLNSEAVFYHIDIQSPEIRDILAKEKPEIVFHLAAQVNVRKSVENPAKDAQINILGGLNILEACAMAGVRKFIFASSGGAIYGEADVIPTPESYPENPESPYGIAKLIMEKYLHYYQKTYGLDYVALRYANLYGPRQNYSGEGGVVAIFTDRMLRGQNIEIFGNGGQTRDFVFVEDAVQAAMLALEKDCSKNPVFNVGTGIETSINELYKMLDKEIGDTRELRYRPAKKGDLVRSCLDITKMKSILSWHPQVGLQEGLKRTISAQRG